MVSGPLRIGRENDVDISVVTASTAVTTLPASNVKDFDIQKIWRATANSANLIWDVGSTLTLGVVMAQNCNGIFTDSFQVRASITDPTVTSSLTYDSGTLPGIDPVYGKFVHFLETHVSYRYGRLDMNFSEPPEVGRLMSGEYWQPSYHMSLVAPPASLWRDPSRRTYSIGQNVFIDSLTPQRGYRFTVAALSDDEKLAQVDELNRLRGLRKDILVCIDAGSSNLGRDSIWGLLEDTVRAERMTGVQNLWTIEMEVWERL